MKKLATLLFLVAFLCSCRHGDTAGGNAVQETDSLALRVALMPTLDCLPFYYAAQNGLFDAAGVDVELLTFNAQMDCDTAFTRSHADVSYTDLIRAALLQSQGTGLYVFMQTDGHHELVTAKSKRIRQPAHLREKMVAMARHSVTDLLLDTVVSQAGIDPATVYHPQINDIVLRCGMLRNTTIDAAFLPEPYATQAKADGHKTVYDSRTQGLQLMAFMLTTKAATDKRKQTQVEKLLEAYDQAVEQLNRHERPDSVRLLLLRYPVEQATIDSLTLPAYTKAGLPHKEKAKEALRFLTYRQLTGNAYSGDTLFTTQFTK